jgi:hypothetical protein
MLAEGTYKSDMVADLPKLSRVWSEDIVVAKEYTGPIHRIQSFTRCP